MNETDMSSPSFFLHVWYLIKGHSVIFDGFAVVFLLEINVSDVDFQASSIVEQLILHYDLISV